MDHIVYLDYRAKEFDNMRIGVKTMIIRGAMGRKIPFGKVVEGDVLFFIENNGDGIVKGKASVQHVYNSCQLTREESMQLVDSFNDKLMFDSGLRKRFRGKRYLVLVTINNFQEIKPFRLNRSGYSSMDDWLLVGEIEELRAGY